MINVWHLLIAGGIWALYILVLDPRKSRRWDRVERRIIDRVDKTNG